MLDGIECELFTLARVQREGGQLGRAVRTVAFFEAYAARMVREFPESARVRRLVAEAFIQRAKNAWKREDLRTVRHEWTLAIQELERAPRLDPGDMGIQRMMKEHRHRLAALPPP